jgi:hypothetical protein
MADLKDAPGYARPDQSFCGACGSKLVPGDTFCASCGREVRGASLGTEGHAVEPPAPTVRGRASKRRGIWWVAAILVVFVTATAILVYVNRPGVSEQLTGPRALEAKPGPLRVTLNWVAPSWGTDVGGYRIYRDGRLLAQLPGTTLEYTDSTALPKQTYTYAVEALSFNGLSSPRALTTARTTSAPLSLARVSGTYAVTLQLQHATQGSVGSDEYDSGWTFTPNCSVGACNVGVNAFAFNGIGPHDSLVQQWPSAAFDATFVLKQGEYQGTAHTFG